MEVIIMGGTIALAAAISVFTGAAAGIGIGLATAKAAESVARQPEASGKILAITLIGATLSEATAIYGMIVAFLLVGKIV
jgi:F-type H+-transporting ATPase subunit c